jgi:hypothetical protein
MADERTCQRCGNPMNHVESEPSPKFGVVGAWVCDLCEIMVSDNDDCTKEENYHWL